MNHFLSNIIPAPVKDKIKRFSWYEKWLARHLAKTSKRIDICSAQIAHLLHLASIRSVKGLVCLEVGSGWVLSHAIVFHLLGAKRVIATDMFAHAHPQVLRYALKEAVTSLPRDILAPFEDHTLIRERMDNLLSISHFNFEALKSIGIEYVCPLDLALENNDIVGIGEVDIVFSLSVLEHVPCKDVSSLLANLEKILVPGGTMLHAIHLEDHRNIARNPFSFLSIPKDAYSRQLQVTRGNRLRASEWQRLFSEIPRMHAKILYAYHRRNMPLPSIIDPSVRHLNTEDLKFSHLGMLATKLC